MYIVHAYDNDAIIELQSEIVEDHFFQIHIRKVVKFLKIEL